MNYGRWGNPEEGWIRRWNRDNHWTEPGYGQWDYLGAPSSIGETALGERYGFGPFSQSVFDEPYDAEIESGSRRPVTRRRKDDGPWLAEANVPCEWCGRTVENAPGNRMRRCGPLVCGSCLHRFPNERERAQHFHSRHATVHNATASEFLGTHLIPLVKPRSNNRTSVQRGQAAVQQNSPRAQEQERDGYERYFGESWPVVYGYEDDQDSAEDYEGYYDEPDPDDRLYDDMVSHVDEMDDLLHRRDPLMVQAEEDEGDWMREAHRSRFDNFGGEMFFQDW
ncbi:hypothetical protein LTS18_005626 [Coniosporium uncinatum]|uniref:Uncharacterized protein n=1 Tax=Coniosporium uncinatum TaxID=93489 RepID=A0ACC3DQX0_9PEZI|nr:hypothetical protein LTS18_005626 [Coniosporium uncinatum]